MNLVQIYNEGFATSHEEGLKRVYDAGREQGLIENSAAPAVFSGGPVETPVEAEKTAPAHDSVTENAVPAPVEAAVTETPTEKAVEALETAAAELKAAEGA